MLVIYIGSGEGSRHRNPVPMGVLRNLIALLKQSEIAATAAHIQSQASRPYRSAQH